MAGFELESQRSGTIPGFGRIEGGYIDFSATSRTAEVVTRCTSYWLGFGIADSTQSDGSGNNFSLIATTDGDISGNNVTFKRQGQYVGADARFRYILFGW